MSIQLRWRVALWVYMALLASVVYPTFAAQDEPTPLPPNTFSELEKYAASVLPHHNLLILAGEEDSALLQALGLEAVYVLEQFNIETTSDYEGVGNQILRRDESADPLDAVVITPSALAYFKGTTVLETLYLDGTVIAFLNTDGETEAEVLGLSACPPKGVYFHKLPDFWFKTYIFRVESLLPEDKQATIEAHRKCKKEDNVKFQAGVRIYVGTSADSLMDELKGLKLLAVLAAKVQSFEAREFSDEEISQFHASQP